MYLIILASRGPQVPLPPRAFRLLRTTQQTAAVRAMGATVSALVFQPPPPTYGYTRRYFFLATTLNNRIPAFFIEHEYVEVGAHCPPTHPG